ncbi:MAG: Fic family protein [Vampirovibrionales bacterium]
MDWKNFRLNTRLSLSGETIEALYQKIAVIDAVKHTFTLTGHLLPQTIDRLTQSVIVTSTGASNRIEGNLLSDNDVEALYKKMRIRSFKTRDEQEVAGYIEMLERIFNHYPNIPLNESNILQLHRDMLQFSTKDERQRGQYKFGSNRVEAKDQDGNIVGVIFEPTPPFLVKKEMDELLGWYDWAIQHSGKHSLILIANFIFEYLAIHPFQDGNGRSSRLLSNLMLLQEGYAFTKLVSHEKIIEAQKADYYLALNKTQKSWKTEEEDMEAWLLFIMDVFLKQAQEAQNLLEADQFEYVLSEKQQAFWTWAKTQETFSRKDVVEALGYGNRTTEEIIKKLYNLKKLERFGEGRATRYRVL